MSIASSQPIETRPGRRFTVPTSATAADRQRVASRSLPGHLELPDENGEIVENFREAPQSLLLDQAIWPILEQLHPDRHFAVGHDCGIYWRLTNPLGKRRGFPRLVLRARRSSRSRWALSSVLCSLEGTRSTGGPHRILLGRRHEGARPNSLRGEVLDLRAGGPRRLLRHLRGRNR